MINIDKLVFIGAFARGAFNCKIGLIWFKTDILLKFYNFFFYVTFFLFFFPKKKERK